MGKDHPVAWCKQVGKGRIWYTALGHTEASFTEPLFLKHLLGGIQAAAGKKRTDFRQSEK
jgi:type 1 glutamine amidotransferase